MMGLKMASRRKHLKPRTQNGRLSEAGQQREHAPTQVRRLRDAALRMVADPEWGTELGRLFLDSKITAMMYAAGKDWREKADKYRKAIGAFPVRSASIEIGRGGSQPDPDSFDGREQAKRERNAMEQFFAAHAKLMTAGKLSETIVRRVCEQDEGPCGTVELIALRNGLSVLAEG